MIELWAVVGLCCTDPTVAQTIQAAVEGNPRDHQQQMKDVMHQTKEYGFRLSLFEVGELIRYFQNPDFAKGVAVLYSIEWPDPPCCTRLTFDPKYNHSAMMRSY
jgi:hypothetical protein